MEILNIDQIQELKGAMEEARKDDTPYMAMDGDSLHVFGNPNKTEVRASDYTVKFVFPNTDEWKKRAQSNGDKIGRETEDGRYFLCERTYKGVFLSPRNIGNAVSALVRIEQFIYDVTENGELRELTLQEMQGLMEVMNHELTDATYELVAAVLRIPYNEIEWMLPLNTIENAVKIAYNNPSAINEGDIFFGSSPEGD